MTGHFRASPGKTQKMGTANQPQGPNQRLGSWKEIAAFFGCDERTLRRWEKERGLPIHRPPGGAGGRVFAYTAELSAWLTSPRNGSESIPVATPEVSEQKAATSRIAYIDGSSPEEGSISAEISAEPARQSGLWKMVGLAAVAILIVASLGVALLYHSPDPDSVAVLPFTTTGGDANTDYLGDGFTESLIGNLAHVPKLKVKSRNSVFLYKGKEVDTRKVGVDLGVSALVTGRIQQSGDEIDLTAELTDVRDNTELWGQHYHGMASDLILLQQRVAGDIAEQLRSKMSVSEKQQVTRQGTQDPEAYQLYLKGLYEWNKRTALDLASAISFFNQAIAKDPHYALAYSGLADAYAVLPNFGGTPSEDFTKSNVAARRALELDPTLAHPHAVLGENEMQYDWDFAGGEAEFKKAFELDPNDATAHQWYADNLSMIGGRDQEALAEINRARQLDPLSPVITRVMGSVLVMGRQFDQAIAVCSKLTTDDPNFAIGHDCLAYAYWGKRMYPQVIQEWKLNAQLNGDPHDAQLVQAMDQGFRSGGWNGALLKGIDVFKVQRKTTYVPGWKIARFYADAGDKEQAFQWLDTSYREHDWLLMGLKTHFPFDPIRDDPRFAELEKKVGLVQ
jgi:TolB-like protein/Tfp pilus assembly protein PilF